MLIFALIVIALTITLGFVFPGLIWQKDLGVRYTRADYESALTKLKYIKDGIPEGLSADEYIYNYGPVVDVNIKLTSAEITAFINTDRPSYYAVKNVQVRINDDGTIDASGALNTDYVLNKFLGGRYSKTEIAKEMPALGLLPASVNVAANFSGSVINNSSSGSLNSLEVQGIPIPSTYINSSEAVNVLTNAINDAIEVGNTKSGSNINRIAVDSGELNIDGSFASSLTRTKK